MVTRDGLSCPVGHYAINPVPRTAIFREAALARREAGMPELPLRIEISSLPGGSWRKTFNPHLGIIGGISVLGTTGIVNPMSEAALVERRSGWISGARPGGCFAAGSGARQLWRTI